MMKNFDLGYVFLILMVVTNLIYVTRYEIGLINLIAISVLCAITLVCIEMRSAIMMNNLKTNELDQE